jgi:hypothetical protein
MRGITAGKKKKLGKRYLVSKISRYSFSSDNVAKKYRRP